MTEDYDYMVTGLGNPNHPANRTNTDDFFDSICLWECLDHYKETGNIEPLENAIAFNKGNQRRAVVQVKELIDLYSTLDGKEYIVNKLTNIKNLLR